MSGSSAAAFIMYFPNSFFYLLDIKFGRNEIFSKRIKRCNVNQTSKNELNSFIKNENLENKNIDIIIDDGAHTDNAILTTLKSLFKTLSREGYYVIEDIDEQFTPETLKFLRDNNSDFYKNNFESVEIFKSKQLVNDVDYSVEHYIAFIKPNNK